VCTLAADYGRVLDTVRDLTSALGRSEQETVLGGTATRAYRLPTA
jgi:L-fuconolactonase